VTPGIELISLTCIGGMANRQSGQNVVFEGEKKGVGKSLYRPRSSLQGASNQATGMVHRYLCKTLRMDGSRGRNVHGGPENARKGECS
jgi:hypothetical protein